MSKRKRVNIGRLLQEKQESVEAVKAFRDSLSKFFSSDSNSLNSSFGSLSDDEKLGVLVSKFGLKSVLCLLEATKEQPLNQFSADVLSEGLSVPLELCDIILKSNISPLSSSTRPGPSSGAEKEPDSVLLLPPCGNCLFCFNKLWQHHKFVEVKVFTVEGVKQGKKLSLRCKKCDIVYKYSVFGNAKTSWTLYDQPRELLEATDCVFLERRLFEFQCNLANHAWVSFVGFAESYNGTFNLTRHTGLNYKQVSSAFFSGELENELRALNRLDMFNLMRVDSDQEKVLVEVEKLRRKQPYPHENCHPACQAKGCGRVFAVDGIWKLRFPHCMYKVKSVVSKIEIPGLPDVCTNVPLRGKAFCQAHCTVAEKSDIPTGIREFLKHCGVQVADTIKSDTGEGKTQTHLDVEDRDSTPVDESEEELECLTDSPVEDSTIRNVDAVLSSVNASLDGSSVVDAQGTLSFIEENSQQMPAIMAGCEEENPMSCRKDTGGRKSLQKWSRGHLFIVRAGGHIEYWQSLYRSESPSQVFLILLAWLAIHLKCISPTEWSKLSLVYDNMCHLDNMRVARKPLPLPWPWSHMWMLPKKCIDRLHIRNHTDDGCKAKYHPDNHLVSGDNTLCCEQTFVWLSRYKKIVCAMPKSHHLFYLHRMVSRRNAYTNLCYLRGYNPILPVVKNAKTT